jgi:hypothetical protein
MSNDPTPSPPSAIGRYFYGLCAGAFDTYLGIVGCLLTVLGAKLWLIDALGGVTPFRDQWGAEGATLFKPYIDGTLQLSQFFTQFNEHRIVFTRLMSLGLLWLNQYWDPVLEMTVDALVQVASLGVILSLLVRTLDRSRVLVFCFFFSVLYAIPFAWENTLMGFAAHFYLLTMFSIVSLWFLHESAAWKPLWWVGIACGIASYFNMASGAMTIAAGIGLTLGQIVTGRRRGWPEMLALGVQGAILLAMLADLPSRLQNPYAAKSFGALLAAFFSRAGWPIDAKPIIAAAILYAPALVIVVLTLRKPPPKEDRRWFVSGAALWMGLQIAALAFGRVDGWVSSRYTDILLLGLAINFLALLIALDAAELRRSLVFKAFAVIWLIVVVIGAGKTTIAYLPPDLVEKHRMNEVETANLSQYLATGNFDDLKNKPPTDIPELSAERLRDVVSLPEIRAILPPALFGRSEPNAGSFGTAVQRISAASIRAVKRWCLHDGRRLLPIGLALFLVGAVFAGGRSECASAKPESRL